MSFALLLLLACDAPPCDLLNSTVPVVTVLDGLMVLDGWKGFGVLPVLPVLRLWLFLPLEILSMEF